MKINETSFAPRMNTSRVSQRTKPVAAGAARPASNRFDTVMISNVRRADENPAATRLREAISLDVRAAAASAAERVPELREQIQSGTYRIDARAIARKILSMGSE